MTIYDILDGGANADIIYGGDGSDTLISDINGDRLIDWFGIFNNYIAPRNGAPTIIRSPAPANRQFIFDLATADGAANAELELQIVYPGGPLQQSNTGKA
jgi:Ca2+-binding RTX toxin-like protein